MKLLNPKYQILSGYNVWFDYDGILSSSMSYDQLGKCQKTAQYGVRHSIEVMLALGANVHVITGDSSGSGRAITEKSISKMNITQYHAIPNIDKLEYILENQEFKFDQFRTIYVADDLFDIVTAQFIKTIVPNNAHPFLKKHAEYVSSSKADEYLAIDVLAFLLTYELTKFKQSIPDQNHLERLLIIIMCNHATKFPVTGIGKITVDDLRLVLLNKLDGNNLITDLFRNSKNK